MVKRLTVVKRLTFVHSWRIQVSPSLCRSSSDPGICPSNGLGGRSVFRGLRSERGDIKRCTAMARCAKRDRGAGCERGWRSCEAAGGISFRNQLHRGVQEPPKPLWVLWVTRSTMDDVRGLHDVQRKGHWVFHRQRSRRL